MKHILKHIHKLQHLIQKVKDTVPRTWYVPKTSTHYYHLSLIDYQTSWLDSKTRVAYIRMKVTSTYIQSIIGDPNEQQYKDTWHAAISAQEAKPLRQNIFALSTLIPWTNWDKRGYPGVSLRNGGYANVTFKQYVGTNAMQFVIETKYTPGDRLLINVSVSGRDEPPVGRTNFVRVDL